MGLNICTLKLVTKLGFSKEDVDSKNTITIKYYCYEEHSSKGSVTFPIIVGTVVKYIVFYVLELELAYNLLLGLLWVHSMQFSTLR